MHYFSLLTKPWPSSRKLGLVPIAQNPVAVHKLASPKGITSHFQDAEQWGPKSPFHQVLSLLITSSCFKFSFPSGFVSRRCFLFSWASLWLFLVLVITWICNPRHSLRQIYFVFNFVLSRVLPVVFCLRLLPLDISEIHSFCFSFHYKRYEYTIQGLSIIYKWAFVLFLFMGPIVVVAVDILMDICIHFSWWF